MAQFLDKTGLSYFWSKIKAAIADAKSAGTTAQDNLSTHDGNTTKHITAAERTAWNNKSNFSGSYNDLTNKPTIPSAYTHPSSHPASMITGLATVATSGSYNDLSNKPTIPAAYTLPAATSSTLGGVKIGSNISVSSGTISVPAADGSKAGVTIVYPAASCTTFSSDAGTVTPLAVQKGAKQFAIPRIAATDKAITRFSGTAGEVQNSKIIIEDVTNSKDSSKKAQVISIPAEGGKKMVYGYCTDQVDGTSFIGGVFDASATSYPYAQGLAIGGTSGNLLWKGSKVATADDLSGKASTAVATTSAAGLMSASDKSKLDGIATGANKTTVDSSLSSSSTNPVQNKVVNSALNAKADKSQAVFYIEGTGDTAGTWLGSHSDITAYYEGLTIAYKVGIAGASGLTLNINGLGAVSVVRNVSTAVTTHYGVNSVVILVYTVDSSGTAYWKVADYDSDTKTRSSNNAGKKMFIIGATTQSTSGQTTYSNSACYIGTDNCLYSNSSKVATTADIPTLSSLGGVPTSRTVNGKALSSNVSLTASDVGAAPAYTYGTSDLTAGSSSLETGKLYFVYE